MADALASRGPLKHWWEVGTPASPPKGCLFCQLVSMLIALNFAMAGDPPYHDFGAQVVDQASTRC